MNYLHSLSSEQLRDYYQVMARSVDVRNHLDALAWLQGDMQRYLPHAILIAAWGDFQTGAVKHDIISALAGVRSKNSNPDSINPVLVRLFKRWAAFSKSPFGLSTGESGFLLENEDGPCALGTALQSMRSASVHGISDERGSYDCLYVVYSTRSHVTDAEQEVLAMVLPYIDSALRQVEHLPHQSHGQGPVHMSARAPGYGALVQEHDLTDREFEIMQWVALGKTNPEIGSILEISEFTVKNHMQRVFKKLTVCSRAQAVAKIHSHFSHV